MKKIYLINTLFVLLNSTIVAQNYSTNVFNIQNYRHDLALSLNENNHFSVKLGAYGKMLNIIGNTKHAYLFQGQEYDQELGVYYFPARMYSAKTYRFLSTDPKSQYHSNYLFVGADPINIIDTDGKVGKPLVLLGEDHTQPFDSGINAVIHDIESEVTDAYYVPMSDFLNGKQIDLPEFNGNVFVMAHTTNEGDFLIEAERANHMDDFSTSRKSPAKMFQSEPDEFTMDVTPEDLGQRLRQFSEENRLPIDNITVGGCQGENAANRIGKSFAKGKQLTGRKLTTKGVKTGHKVNVLGKHGSFLDEEVIEPLQQTTYYTRPVGAHSNIDLEELEEGGYKAKGMSFKLPDGSPAEFQSAQGRELSDLVVNGRAPERMPFKSFHFEY